LATSAEGRELDVQLGGHASKSDRTAEGTPSPIRPVPTGYVRRSRNPCPSDEVLGTGHPARQRPALHPAPQLTPAVP
jgi:hypothetical protein